MVINAAPVYKEIDSLFEEIELARREAANIKPIIIKDDIMSQLTNQTGNSNFFTQESNLNKSYFQQTKKCFLNSISKEEIPVKNLLKTNCAVTIDNSVSLERRNDIEVIRNTHGTKKIGRSTSVRKIDDFFTLSKNGNHITLDKMETKECLAKGSKRLFSCINAINTNSKKPKGDLDNDIVSKTKECKKTIITRDKSNRKNTTLEQYGIITSAMK